MSLNARLLLLFCCFSGFCVRSAVCVAQVYPVRKYDIRDGLAGNQFITMMQDRTGYLWIGTCGAGVYRFDGLQFINYNISTGLADNIVNSIFQDSRGNIWFGTHHGVTRMSGDSCITYTTTSGLPNDNVRAIIEDEHGDLWFGTAQGVSRFDGREFHNFMPGSSAKGNIVREAFIDSRSVIWFGTEQGIFKYDGTKFVTDSVTTLLKNLSVWTILEQPVGRLWFGTVQEGVYTFDGATMSRITPAGDPDYMNVQCMTTDRQGDLWFGFFSGGITQFDGHTLMNFRMPHNLPTDRTRSMFCDTEGNIWVGTYDACLYMFPSIPEAFYVPDELRSSTQVRTIMKDRRGRLWIGGRDGGVVRYDGSAFTQVSYSNGTPVNDVTVMIEDAQGHLLFAQGNNTVLRWDSLNVANYVTLPQVKDRIIQDMAIDSQGTLWIASDHDSLYQYDGQTLTEISAQFILKSGWIWDLQVDKEGDLWIATGGRGVYRYDGSQFHSYTKADGLPNDWVTSISLDRAGVLWFTTWGGVSRYDGKEFTNYSMVDGFSSDNCYFMFQDDRFYYLTTEVGVDRFRKRDGRLEIDAFIKSKDTGVGTFGTGCADKQGVLWFGGARVWKFNMGLVSPPVNAPPVRITSINVMGRDIPVHHNMEFGPGMNVVTVHFNGINFKTPKEVVYRYRLSSLEEDWRETRQREITYVSIPPGTYTFMIQARVADGLWTEKPANWTFTIHPPIWQTLWFRISGGLMLMSMVVGIRKLRTRTIKRRNQELEATVCRRTQTITIHLDELAAAKGMLEDARDELEGVVEERTKTLQKTIESLYQEVTERQRMERQLRAFASQLTTTEERLRRNIAVALHDQIGQNLAFALAKVKTMMQRQPRQTVGSEKSWEELKALIDQSLRDTRSMSLELAPPALYELDLVSAVKWLVDRMQSQYGLRVYFSDDRLPKPLDDNMKVLLFSATRELLVNVRKHAHAQHVQVSVQRDDNIIRLTVSDDGRGFDLPPEKVHVDETGGFGLFNIRERLRSVNGQIVVESSAGQGTRITLHVPLMQDILKEETHQ